LSVIAKELEIYPVLNLMPMFSAIFAVGNLGMEKMATRSSLPKAK